MAGYHRAKWYAPIILTLGFCACTQTAWAQELAPQVPVAPVTSSGSLFEPNDPASRATRSFVADLFAPLATDFRHLASEKNLIIAGIGGAAAATVHTWDTSTTQSVWSARFDSVMKPGQYVGDSYVQMGGALAAYTLGRVSGSPRVERLGAALFRAQVVAEATAEVIKMSANRTRPDGTSLSFPSGHSAAAFATATVLQSEFGWKAGVPAYAVASWVAASRVEMKRHFVSDVVAGATIGVLAGRSVTVGTSHTRFAVGPIVVPGGVGIGFTRQGK